LKDAPPIPRSIVRWIPAGCAAAALLITFLGSHSSFASDVVLVQPPAADSFLQEVFHRLNGELRVHGFSTKQESVSREASLRLARDLLERTGADACMFLVWQGETSVIEVWVAAPASPPVLFEAVALRRSPEVPMKLAVRAVDLLKAALARDRLAVLPAPTPPAVAMTASVAPVAPALSRWSVEVGGCFLMDWRAFGAAWGPQILLARAVSDRLAVAVRVAGPAFGAGHSTANAGVDLVQGFGLVEGLAIIARNAGFALRAAAGAGGYSCDARAGQSAVAHRRDASDGGHSRFGVKTIRRRAAFGVRDDRQAPNLCRSEEVPSRR